MVIQTVRIIPIVAAFFLTALVALPCGGQEKWLATTPDPRTQELIQRAIVGLAEGKEDRGMMEKLQEMAERSPEILVRQFIIYLIAASEKDGLAMIVLMDKFGTEYNPQIRRGLTPLLESEDEKQRYEVKRWLCNIDGFNRPDAESYFAFYRATLAGQRNAPPAGLVNYLFSMAPGKALLLFGQIQFANADPKTVHRSFMWSDHVISTAKWRISNRFLQPSDLENVRKELESLSKHEGWYARRYVLEVLEDVPEFGTPEMVNRLKKDANPLVAERAKLLK